MAGDGYKLDSLRPNRLENDRILIALALSVLAHALIFGGYELRRDINLPPWLHWLAAKKHPPVMVVVQPQEQPLEFVTVPNPSAEAPKNAKYFSNHNSIASDDSANQLSQNPLLSGRQTDVPAAVDMRPQFTKSETGQNQQEASSGQGQSQSKPSTQSGDLTLGKASETTQQEQPRPRTLRDAYAEMARHLPSMTMSENGGTGHHARTASFDVKVTGYGDYDERFVETVDENWNNLLESQKFALDRTGKVVLLFQLNYDGSISDMRVAQTTVGELLAYVCEKAVLEGAPYERWTEDMRLQLGNSISVEYIFDY
jgi:hypothetical protein